MMNLLHFTPQSVGVGLFKRGSLSFGKLSELVVSSEQVVFLSLSDSARLMCLVSLFNSMPSETTNPINPIIMRAIPTNTCQEGRKC